jgi:hypothetical protein
MKLFKGFSNWFEKYDVICAILSVFLILALMAAGIIWAVTSSYKREAIRKIQEEKLEILYEKLTPAYDKSAIIGNSNEILAGFDHKQKIKIIGFNAMNFWLKDCENKKVIVSITAINRGVQGSTSSFLVVYIDYR